MQRVYDLAMTHKLDSDGFFIHRVQEHCAAAGLDFFLIEPLWAEAFLAALERGDVRTRVLLNMHSEHHDPQDLFHRLVLEAHRAGAQVIDPPELAQAAFDKGRLHPRLIEAGIPTPHTIVVERAQAGELQLSAGDRELLGTPFVVKPGMGYGRKGLVLDAVDASDLARSVTLFPDARYLLQHKAVPATHTDGEPLYFRAFYVFGAVSITWWNCFTDRYRLATREEIDRLELSRLEDVSRRLAALTGMRFFSSEMLFEDSGELLVIDYINDQCHMLCQSADPQRGVPDALVADVARQLFEGALGMIRGEIAGGSPLPP
jgi:hypothetical protein